MITNSFLKMDRSLLSKTSSVTTSSTTSGTGAKIERMSRKPENGQKQQKGGSSRTFGKVLQSSSGTSSSGSRKKSAVSPSTFIMPNPHERLWNPSPYKRAKASVESSRWQNEVGVENVGGCLKGEGRNSDDVRSKNRKNGKCSAVNKENNKNIQTSKYFPSISTNSNRRKRSSSTNSPDTHDYNSIQWAADVSLPMNLSLTLSPELQSPATTEILPGISTAIGTTCLSSDLNNSFTEKISNLDIGRSVDPSPLLPLTISNCEQGKQKTQDSEYSQESQVPAKANNDNEENSIIGIQSSTNSSFRLKNNKSGRKPRSHWREHLDPDCPYITEILNYWHKLEVENIVIDPAYMEKQKEISFKMRTILVDWLVEVAEEYSICNATLHRSVQFVDRFLSKFQISRSNLQLLGTTCLFIACKIEEIHPPETGDLVYITDNTYDKAQLVQMECLVLSVLDFDLLTPTAYEFTEYFASALSLSSTTKEFSHYAAELTLLYGERFLEFSPSVMGVAAVYVGIRCCGADYGQHDFKHFQTKNSYNSNNVRNAASNNKSRKSHFRPDNDNDSVLSVISRIKRLNPNQEFIKTVEQAVSQIFVMLMSVSSSTNSSPKGILIESSLEPANSVCTKYKKFQEQAYFVAAATAAACFPSPWHSSLLNS